MYYDDDDDGEATSVLFPEDLVHSLFCAYEKYYSKTVDKVIKRNVLKSSNFGTWVDEWGGYGFNVYEIAELRRQLAGEPKKKGRVSKTPAPSEML